ncbi:HupE/UreJ family protein [Paenibacillus antri]|uniref:HupE/UreJ family protein n=1 Tax=Paenibacillus antri TaxID=2582848 RepID=UPI0013053A5B|nr:HupE/UreJ family protein [Paenibacillus antri]
MRHRFAGTIGWAAAVVAALGSTFISGTASAHAGSTGYSEIVVEDRGLAYGLFVSEQDLAETLPDLDLDRDERISPEELRTGIDAIEAFVNDGIAVTGDGELGTGEVEGAAFDEKAKSPMVRIDIRYGYEAPVSRFMIQYGLLFDTHPDYRNFASIRIGEHTVDQVLNASNTILQIAGANGAAAEGARGADVSWTSTLGTFVWMGMEHIWGGLDHMLFVLALLLNVRGWKSLAATITAFTLGHSATLALSALELASLSPLVVEPVIALSILYVAAENVLRREEADRSRLQVTALFGLVHGFGFAEILHGTLSGNVALPLFSFNLGVEIGQLVVVAAALPLLWSVRRYAGRIPWARYASGAVGAFGLYWFCERVLENMK